MRQLTKEYLHELFEYREGYLYWKEHKQNRKMTSFVGSSNSSGRLTVWIDGKSYLVHRLIYLYHHGYLPEFVDHSDNNCLNNKITNLRCASRSENNRNCKIRKDNITGVKGVYPKNNKFIAHLRIENKLTYLGTFKTLEEASLCVTLAREQHHKGFARHG
jgi:hypothetical protein